MIRLIDYKTNKLFQHLEQKDAAKESYARVEFGGRQAGE